MKELSQNLDKIVDESLWDYPIVPITRIEDIQDGETKSTLLKISESNSLESKLTYSSETDFSFKSLLQPEFKDPRSLTRKIYDGIKIMIYPESRTVKLSKEVDAKIKIAKAKFEYNYLKNTYGLIGKAIKARKNAYEGIADYYSNIEKGIKMIEQRNSNIEKEILSNHEQIKTIESDLKDSELQKSLNESFGDKGETPEFHIIFEKQKGKHSKKIAHIGQERKYLEMLNNHYSGASVSCRNSLQLIEEDIEDYQSNQLRLRMLLDTFDGLTKNQIKYTEVTLFLQKVSEMGKDLKGSMEKIEELFKDTTLNFQFSKENFLGKN